VRTAGGLLYSLLAACALGCAPRLMMPRAPQYAGPPACHGLSPTVTLQVSWHCVVRCCAASMFQEQGRRYGHQWHVSWIVMLTHSPRFSANDQTATVVAIRSDCSQRGVERTRAAGCVRAVCVCVQHMMECLGRNSCRVARCLAVRCLLLQFLLADPCSGCWLLCVYCKCMSVMTA
jgi:hypothetical protein